MNSATVVTGREGLTSITRGNRTRPATGAMSRRKLKGSRSYRLGLIALAVPITSSV
jgi:hypothetical protein